jgi:hypothetical protein
MVNNKPPGLGFPRRWRKEPCLLSGTMLSSRFSWSTTWRWRWSRRGTRPGSNFSSSASCPSSSWGHPLPVHAAVRRGGPVPLSPWGRSGARKYRAGGIGHDLRRRGWGRRGQEGAPGGGGVPPGSQAVPRPGSGGAQGRPAGGSAGHRQDPPGPGRGGGGPRELLHHHGVRLHGDVRGCGGQAGPGPLQAGQGRGAQHHLHRRAGLHWPSAGCGPGREGTTSGSRP